jgi:hypothetical protein
MNVNTDESDIDERMIKDVLAYTVKEYISSLSHENKLTMSNDIISKFTEVKTNQKIKSAKALFLFYSKLRGKEHKHHLYKRLDRWRRVTTLEILKSPSLALSRTQSKSHIVNESKTHNMSYCSKMPVRETLDDKKYKDDVLNCTFIPKINRNYDLSAFNRNPKTFDRLYTDHEMYLNKHNVRTAAKEKREASKLSFSPDMSLTQNKNNRQNESFMERQNKYFENKKQRYQKIRNDMDSSTNSECTFRPTLNNNKSFSKDRISSPGQSRLYNSTMRKQNSLKENSKTATNNKQVDYRRLEELYNDYKKHNYNRTKLKDAIYEENGITFKPHLNSNLPPNGLIERNYKMLEDKKSFIHNFYKEEKVEKGHRRVISNKTIERLYERGVEKMLQRNMDENKTPELKDTQKDKVLRNFTFYGTNNVSLRGNERESEKNYQSEMEPINVDTVVYHPDEEDNRPLKPETVKRTKPTLDFKYDGGEKQSSSKKYNTLGNENQQYRFNNTLELRDSLSND